MPGKVRRLVTAINEEGRSYFLTDSEVPAGELPPDGRVRAGMWLTQSAPASNEGIADAVPDGVINTIAPQDRGGTVFRVTDILPDSGPSASSAHELASRGAHTSAERSAKHPGFHQTETVDYAIVLEGEIWAILDEGERLMKAGDVLIQRGTHHAWANRSDKPCRMAFILIDAEPLAASTWEPGRKHAAH